MRQISSERKLKFLQIYMNEFIEKWPLKVKPFPQWLESTLDKAANKGRNIARQKAKGKCRYCRRLFELHGLTATKDHVVPLSRGGLDHKENRVYACFECNQWKKDRPLSEWLKEIKSFVKKQKPRNLDYDLHVLGTMVGTIESVLREVKQHEKKASMYKVRK